MTVKEIQSKAKFSLCIPTQKDRKWLAKIKASGTLWFDEYSETFDYNKPYADAQVAIRRNAILFIYEEDDVIDGCKYVGRLASGALKIGWKTLKNAIEDTSFDIVEFTEKCKKQYLDEVANG